MGRQKETRTEKIVKDLIENKAIIDYLKSFGKYFRSVSEKSADVNDFATKVKERIYGKDNSSWDGTGKQPNTKISLKTKNGNKALKERIKKLNNLIINANPELFPPPSNLSLALLDLHFQGLVSEQNRYLGISHSFKEYSGEYRNKHDDSPTVAIPYLNLDIEILASIEEVRDYLETVKPELEKRLSKIKTFRKKSMRDRDKRIYDLRNLGYEYTRISSQLEKEGYEEFSLVTLRNAYRRYKKMHK